MQPVWEQLDHVCECFSLLLLQIKGYPTLKVFHKGEEYKVMFLSNKGLYVHIVMICQLQQVVQLLVH